MDELKRLDLNVAGLPLTLKKGDSVVVDAVVPDGVNHGFRNFRPAKVRVEVLE